MTQQDQETKSVADSLLTKPGVSVTICLYCLYMFTSSRYLTKIAQLATFRHKYMDFYFIDLT